MPLQHDEPPAPVHELVHNRLGALAHYGAFHTRRLRHAKADGLCLSTPHRIAVLTARSITARKTWTQHIGTAGWRFLIHDGDEVVATADTVSGEDGEHRFGHINEGPLVAGTTRAIIWAEQHPTIRAGSFEPIFVLAPELSVALLLLKHRAAGGDDYVTALPPLFAGLKDRELLDPKQVINSLRPMLARRDAHAKSGWKT